jgi:hypothetical protein
MRRILVLGKQNLQAQNRSSTVTIDLDVSFRETQTERRDGYVSLLRIPEATWAKVLRAYGCRLPPARFGRPVRGTL